MPIRNPPNYEKLFPPQIFYPAMRDGRVIVMMEFSAVWTTTPRLCAEQSCYWVLE